MDLALNNLQWLISHKTNPLREFSFFILNFSVLFLWSDLVPLPFGSFFFCQYVSIYLFNLY